MAREKSLPAPLASDGDEVVLRDPGRLEEACGRLADDPLAFVLWAFDWNGGELAGNHGPDGWQRRMLETVRDLIAAGKPVRIAVASGHGVGKTALVAWLAIWFLATRRSPQVVLTANTARQLDTKTWREVAKWLRLCRVRDWFRLGAGRIAHKQEPLTWFAAAVPWNAAEPEAFAGTHERDVLMLFDEASAIDDAIWDVTEGAMTTAGAMWCVFGNPTRAEGRFADCFGRLRHRWTTARVDAREVPRADRDQVARWVEDYGLDSDFVRVRVRGEFPRVSSDGFIAHDVAAEARRRALAGTRPGMAVMGVDVARFGDDESVAVLRRGGALVELRRWRGLDTMTLAGEVAGLIRQWRPAHVFVDGVGVGGGVVDRLRQLGFRTIDVNAGARAADENRFANLRVEMWSRMRDWLRDGGALVAGDEALARDLVRPTYAFDNRGRLRLESKDDMRSRGEPSPDAGDALALTFAWPVRESDEDGHAPRQLWADDSYRMLP